MATINQLSAVDSLQGGDQIPVYDQSNGDARKASMTTLSTYIIDALGSDINYFNQFASPAASNFNVLLQQTGQSIWLVINPTTSFALGQITLPPTSFLTDDQEIIVVCTEEVIDFTVNGSGATVVGAPTYLPAYSAFSMRYSLDLGTWYVMNNTGSGATGATSITRDDFTGDGTTTDFTLGAEPGALGEALIVTIDGLYQEAANYTVTGTTLSFSTAPPLGSAIETMSFVTAPFGTTTANLVSYSQGGTNSVVRTVESRLRDFVSVKDFGAVGDGVTDDTAAIQAAHATGKSIFYPDGTYILSDEINLESNASITLSGGTRINQTTDNKSIFKATTKTNISINGNGAVLQGYGNYSNTWIGNSNHLDRVISFTSCIICRVKDIALINGSNAGLYLESCIRCEFNNLFIKGTHSYGSPIVTNDNFQNGIFIKHDDINGDCIDIQITDFYVSETAQGVLVEGYSTYVQDTDNIILKGIVRDVKGQHGFYIQTGKVKVDATVTDCALSGMKIQVGSSNAAIKDFDISLQAHGCGSHGLEIQNAGTVGVGSISNIIFDILATNCQRGIGIVNDVKNVRGTLIADTPSQYGIIIDGANNENIDIDVTCLNSGRHGIFVTSNTTTGLIIRPVVKESNTSAGAYYGIYIEDVGDMVLLNPQVTDVNTNQVYALFVLAGSVKVQGRAVFTGASSYSARANVLLADWPEDVDIGGTSASKLLNISNFGYSIGVNRQTGQSTSTSPITLWQVPLDDESAYMITADILAKKSDSSERRATRISGLFYRDGGGSATREGADTVISNIASGSDTSNILVEPSGNTVRIRCHSGASVTYDWVSNVEVEKIS